MFRRHARPVRVDLKPPLLSPSLCPSSSRKLWGSNFPCAPFHSASFGEAILTMELPKQHATSLVGSRFTPQACRQFRWRRSYWHEMSRAAERIHPASRIHRQYCKAHTSGPMRQIRGMPGWQQKQFQQQLCIQVYFVLTMLTATRNSPTQLWVCPATPGIDALDALKGPTCLTTPVKNVVLLHGYGSFLS